MMTFYRVEDKNGQGPYRNSEMINKLGIPSSWMDKENCEGGRTPQPQCDNPRYVEVYFDCVFGFYDWVQVSSWFTDNELKAMEEYGFTVNVVYGEPIAFLERQVIFRRINNVGNRDYGRC